MNDEQQPSAPEPSNGQWQYKPDGTSAPAGDAAPTPPLDEAPARDVAGPTEVTWTASEFIAHHKSFKWYALLGLSSLVFAALVYWLTKDTFTTGVIIFAAIVFGYAAGRKPRVLTYKLDERGLMIASKQYPYGSMKSFAILQEGAAKGMVFLPLKRFLPSLTVYYDPKDEDEIAAVISQHLPLERHQPDIMDRFSSRVRF